MRIQDHHITYIHHAVIHPHPPKANLFSWRSPWQQKMMLLLFLFLCLIVHFESPHDAHTVINTSVRVERRKVIRLLADKINISIRVFKNALKNVLGLRSELSVSEITDWVFCVFLKMAASPPALYPVQVPPPPAPSAPAWTSASVSRRKDFWVTYLKTSGSPFQLFIRPFVRIHKNRWLWRDCKYTTCCPPPPTQTHTPDDHTCPASQRENTGPSPAQSLSSSPSSSSVCRHIHKPAQSIRLTFTPVDENNRSCCSVFSRNAVLHKISHQLPVFWQTHHRLSQSDPPPWC